MKVLCLFYPTIPSPTLHVDFFAFAAIITAKVINGCVIDEDGLDRLSEV